MKANFTSRAVGVASLALLIAAAGCTTPKLAQNEQAAVETVEIPAEVQGQYGEALERLQAGDLDAATLDFEIFVQNYPDYAAAYINLASIYVQQERYEDALAMTSRALELDGTNPVALNRLGMLKRRSGDFAAAESAWRSAIASNPDYPYAWYNLGVLYDLYLQNLPEALVHYQAYQRLSGGAESDATVARWIADLESRIDSLPQTAQAR
jgi:tetratricopeptide (TPR) repeat protein